MNWLFKSKVWLTYHLKAHYRRGHHVHSPYTFRLFTNVLFERWGYYSFPKIESVRKKLPHSTHSLPADNPKYTQLLQRLCATNNAKTIVELGRSNGISTMYLASNDSKSTVYSISEKKPTDIFKLTGINNVRQCKPKDLQETLNQIDNLDVLYVRSSCGFRDIDSLFNLCKPKCKDGSIFIFDNIHDNPMTEEQWNIILRSEEITLSLDLYRLGVVWFRKELKRQHYTVKY